MTTPVALGATQERCCGGGDCPPGACADGEECLPSNYIDPDDCPACPECPCPEGGYVPYCIGPENADDADTAILALNPFAYYVGDDASGNPQDSSGNGNHATGTVATVSYAQGPLTSKTTDSIAITAGGKISFPVPAADNTLMRHTGNDATNPWTISVLVMFTARDGGDGGTERVWLSQLGSTGINWVCAFPQSGTGTVDLMNILIGTAWRTSGEPRFDLDVPYVVTIVRDDSGQSIAQSDFVKVYVDGVIWVQIPASSGDGGSTGEDFFLGRPSDEFWGAPDLVWSNLATFDRALTASEVRVITEALADAALLASGPVPS